MELKQIHYFVELASREHISQTADHLHLSQPALSKSLNALEEELGVKLFDRQGKRIALNEQGKIFLSYVKQGINSIDQGIQMARRFRYEVTGHIRIQSVLDLPQLEDKVFAYHTLNPHVKFTLSRTISSGWPEEDIDFISCTNLDEFVPFAKARFWTVEELGDGELGILTAEDGPWNLKDRDGPVDLADFADIPFVMPVGNRNAPSDLGDRICRAAGFFPNVICQSSDSNFRLGMVARGMGVTLITKNHAQKIAPLHSNLRFISLNDSYCRHKYCLMHPKKNLMSEAARDFLQFLHDN